MQVILEILEGATATLSYTFRRLSDDAVFTPSAPVFRMHKPGAEPVTLTAVQQPDLSYLVDVPTDKTGDWKFVADSAPGEIRVDPPAIIRVKARSF